MSVALGQKEPSDENMVWIENGENGGWPKVFPYHNTDKYCNIVIVASVGFEDTLATKGD